MASKGGKVAAKAAQPLLKRLVSNKLLNHLLTYHLLVYAGIVSAYLLIDFDRHFIVPDFIPKPTPPEAIFYYALCTHSNVMAGEIIPRTPFGRALLETHVWCTWIVMVFLLVPWD